MSRTERTQIRISWRDAGWPAGKPTAVRLFKHAALALEWVQHLESDLQAPEITVEERIMSTTPWRPCDLGAGR